MSHVPPDLWAVPKWRLDGRSAPDHDPEGGKWDHDVLSCSGLSRSYLLECFDGITAVAIFTINRMTRFMVTLLCVLVERLVWHRTVGSAEAFGASQVGTSVMVQRSASRKGSA